LWEAYGGLPNIGLPRSPLAALLVEWAGVQNASYLFSDCPEKVVEALGMMVEQKEPILDAVCELAPPLVHFPDNLCSECSTRLYESHMAGTHQRRIERLYAAGIKCAVHLDGAVRGLLPKLAYSGFDAVEALADGHVWYYKNIGTPTEAKLAEGVRFRLKDGRFVKVGRYKEGDSPGLIETPACWLARSSAIPDTPTYRASRLFAYEQPQHPVHGPASSTNTTMNIRSRQYISDIQIPRLQRVFFDKLPWRLDVVAHQDSKCITIAAFAYYRSRRRSTTVCHCWVKPS
jgi:hypothetical protein